MRLVALVDLDCFYAQAGMLCEPKLCEGPIAITQKLICATTNYAARRLGVGKLSRIKDAIKLVPNLVLRSGEDLFYFRKASWSVFQACVKFMGMAASIQRVGLDEFFFEFESSSYSPCASQVCSRELVWPGFIQSTVQDQAIGVHRAWADIDLEVVLRLLRCQNCRLKQSIPSDAAVEPQLPSRASFTVDELTANEVQAGCVAPAFLSPILALITAAGDQASPPQSPSQESTKRLLEGSRLAVDPSCKLTTSSEVFHSWQAAVSQSAPEENGVLEPLVQSGPQVGGQTWGVRRAQHPDQRSSQGPLASYDPDRDRDPDRGIWSSRFPVSGMGLGRNRPLACRTGVQPCVPGPAEQSHPMEGNDKESPALVAAADSAGAGSTDSTMRNEIQPEVPVPAEAEKQRLHRSIRVSIRKSEHLVGSAGHQAEVRLCQFAWVIACLRWRIRRFTGFTTCAGVGTSKLAAKLAAGLRKPNRQCVVLPAAVAPMVLPLQVGMLPGIGSTTSRLLEQHGLLTAGDVVARLRGFRGGSFSHDMQLQATADVHAIDSSAQSGARSGTCGGTGSGSGTMSQRSTSELGVALARVLGLGTGGSAGRQALLVAHVCHGIDTSPVIQLTPPKQITDEDSFRKLDTPADMRSKLECLCAGVLSRLIEDGRTPRLLRLQVMRGERIRKSKSCAVPALGIRHLNQEHGSPAESQIPDLSAPKHHGKMLHESLSSQWMNPSQKAGPYGTIKPVAPTGSGLPAWASGAKPVPGSVAVIALARACWVMLCHLVPELARRSITFDAAGGEGSSLLPHIQDSRASKPSAGAEKSNSYVSAQALRLDPPIIVLNVGLTHFKEGAKSRSSSSGSPVKGSRSAAPSTMKVWLTSRDESHDTIGAGSAPSTAPDPVLDSGPDIEQADGFHALASSPFQRRKRSRAPEGIAVSDRMQQSLSRLSAGVVSAGEKLRGSRQHDPGDGSGSVEGDSIASMSSDEVEVIEDETREAKTIVSRKREGTPMLLEATAQFGIAREVGTVLMQPNYRNARKRPRVASRSRGRARGVGHQSRVGIGRAASRQRSQDLRGSLSGFVSRERVEE